MKPTAQRITIRTEWLVMISITATLAACADGAPRGTTSPITRTDSTADTIHGVAVEDPYRWLENQESDETRAWIDEQNAHARTVLAAIPGRDALQQRIASLLRVETVTQPIERGGRYFFMKRAPDQQLHVIYVREGEAGVDRKLIDPHEMSVDQSTSVSLLGVSRNGDLVTYAIRQGGEDETEVRFFDVEVNRDLDFTLPRGRYFGVDMMPDRSGVYYTRHDANGPRTFHHPMSGPVTTDPLIFGEGLGADKIVASAITENGNYLGILVLHGAAGDHTEVHYLDLVKGGSVRPIVSGIEARFLPAFAADRVVMQTNWNAPNGRVMVASLDDPSPARWKEIVPASDAVIQAVSALGGRVFVNTLKDVQSHLDVYDIDGAGVATVELPSPGTVASLSGRWGSPEVFFTFTSFHVPPTIFRYDVATGRRNEWFRPNVPVNPDDLVVEQVWFASKDGTRVPMFLVHRRDFVPDGDGPALLTGYGGFNLNITPYFAAEAVIVAEHGGVFAVANLRGGGEFGDAWHQAGMLGNKQNTFDDFIAAGEWLVAQRYTSPRRLGIIGGSNGGLLVGAAMTQRPDLFQAVICEYPLLDMVRYDRFLVAGFWVPEYGSARDSAQFNTLFAYSPYHNVRDGVDYPATLFITGDADTRVAPLHARKMAARVQAATVGSRPVLLLYDTRSGHAGGAPVRKQVVDLTDALLFFFGQTGQSG